MIGCVQSPLLIVDGDNLAHRAYHSTPKSVTGVGGAPINALVGFFSMLVNIWQKETQYPNTSTPQYPPLRIFVAWDTLGVDTYRSKLWPPYQTGRIFEPEIVVQLNLLPGICEAFNLGVGKNAGYEADDLMAAAAHREVEGGGTCLILTTDRDSYQLVSEHVTILTPRRGTRELDRIGPHEVVAHFGVLPEQVPDFKALCGDASDKFPGIRGIGPKAAASLLLKHGSLEKVIEAWDRPQSDADLALKFREVARMRPEGALPDPPTDWPDRFHPDWAAGSEAVRALGATNLADRLAALA